MSKKDQKAAVVYGATHLADWLINRNGRKHGLPQWQIELLKVGATLLIVAMV